MKKMLMILAMSAMAMAQTATTDATTTKSDKKMAKHAKMHDADDKKAPAAAGEKTLTGCLHKDGDNMWLQTGKMGMSKMGMGSKYHVMSNDDLSAHDGHKVKITGKVSKGPLGDQKEVKHLEATKVDMVGDTCGETAKAEKKEEKQEKKATTTKKKM
jgi:hypothetical protein